MSYLLDFVKSFDDNELKQFRLLDLAGKEELIRDEYANHAGKKNFHENNLVAKYQLTQSHFDKINSIILDKTIAQFYGTDYLLCLRSLLRKGLSQLMLHELKIMERRLIKTVATCEKSKFYLAAFESLQGMFHPNYNSKLTAAYGKKYLQSLGKNTTLADEAYVGLRLHQADMLSQSVAGKENEYRPFALDVLKSWYKKLSGTRFSEAWFHYYFTYSNYVKYYGTEVKEFTDALMKCVELLPDLSTEFRKSYEFRIYCELGFGCIEGGDFFQAEEYYSRAFNLPNAANQIRPYQSGSYLNVCLINKTYSQGILIFENYLRKYLVPGTNRSLQFDILVNAFCLQLHIANYDEAFEFLQSLKLFKKNEVSRQADMIVRVCETMHFYCLKDYTVAKVIANKNLRFLNRAENRNEQFEYYRQLVYCIFQLSTHKQKNKPIPDILRQRVNNLKGGLYQIFNQLL
ncbi:MAG: hypothetical protein U0T74_08830 [Chitinophagales bacterium]